MKALEKADSSLTTIIDNVVSLPVLTKEDSKFLIEHADYLNKVFENCYMWRTHCQKESIIADANHPTLHSKFHQAILEQKVQTDQAFYLAKDYELKKIEIEETQLDISELKDTPRDNLKRRKLDIELKFKIYELKAAKTAMHYRMSEVKDWQTIEDKLIKQMKEDGLDDETIWNKEAGEISSSFLSSLTRMQGLSSSTDSAEVHNLISLAVFSTEQAQQVNMFDDLIGKLNPQQKGALNFLKEQGYIKV